jgi:hypothetical protein
MHDIFDLGDVFELLSLVWDAVELIIRVTARIVRWMTTQKIREGTRTIYLEKRTSRAAERDRFFSPTRRRRAGWRKAFAVR